jgi:hypothetical protein
MDVQHPKRSTRRLERTRAGTVLKKPTGIDLEDRARYCLKQE